MRKLNILCSSCGMVLPNKTKTCPKCGYHHSRNVSKKGGDYIYVPSHKLHPLVVKVCEKLMSKPLSYRNSIYEVAKEVDISETSNVTDLSWFVICDDILDMMKDNGFVLLFEDDDEKLPQDAIFVLTKSGLLI